MLIGAENRLLLTQQTPFLRNQPIQRDFYGLGKRSTIFYVIFLLFFHQCEYYVNEFVVYSIEHRPLVFTFVHFGQVVVAEFTFDSDGTHSR